MNSLDQFIELALKGLMIAAFALTITLTSFFIWTAVFIPIVKLRQHNLEKQKQNEESYKIEIKKAEAIMLIDEKKKEYADLTKLVLDEKLVFEQLKKKNKDIAESIDSADKKAASTTKSKAPAKKVKAPATETKTATAPA